MVKPNTKLRILSLLLILLSFLFLFSSFTVGVSADGGKLLYAGGMPFGVKFYSSGVVVAGFSDDSNVSGKNPGILAGLRKDDILLSLDGRDLTQGEDFLSIIKNSGGESMKLIYEREGERHETYLTPIYSKDEKRYKCGMYIRQGGAGIGTVTYIDPDTLAFGGLGHGICDTGSGVLLPISHGITLNVSINGLIRGKAGTPGEIRGSFAEGRTGVVYSNTRTGVFGYFSSLPVSASKEKYPAARREETHEGSAYILCTLENGKTPERYEIEISAIKLDAEDDDNKCFTVKVKDERLLTKTGGIIQGMSGSPIIQGSKIVGAVTHVMISDPTVGYGIFIENMLKSASDTRREE